jgi:hypothetical protein
MTGKWIGFGRDFDLNTGPWTLELVTGTVTVTVTVTEEILKEYSRPADGELANLLSSAMSMGPPAESSCHGDGTTWFAS